MPARIWRAARPVGIFAAVCALLLAGKISYGIVKYKTYVWLPSQLKSMITAKEEVPDGQKHLIFVMVDHYEPGAGAKGIERNRQWIGQFVGIAKRHRDSYGNDFRYTWFYPYDRREDDVLIDLCDAVYRGFGEVELHWHHPPATSKTFPGMLKEAVRWFQQYGALISFESTPRTHFAFIHGNWALDNSRPVCGVDNELAILFDQGCYADFTFSTIGTEAQPRKINSIYYASDDGRPKSYDWGEDVAAGKPVNDKLMIFEGPLAYTFPMFGMEYGAVESYMIPTADRINRWIDANIHVRGRPEWVFAKVYSHGMQSKSVILDGALDGMLSDIEAIAGRRKIALHYMTAREAFNVVKAAEDGRTGDPESFRNYRIARPVNAAIRTTVPLPIAEIRDRVGKMVERKGGLESR